MDQSQLEEFKSLLNGDSSALNQELLSAINNPDYIEEARKQMLQSPEMAEAFGISEEILQDPRKWAELMSENLNGLMNLDGHSNPKRKASRRE